MISAIVYTSGTGYTAEYARLLSDWTGLPAYPADRVPPPKTGREIIYLGWLCAGGVKGRRAASARHTVRALCRVGMGPPSPEADRKASEKAGIPVFTLQGGFDLRKLHGPYRWIMERKCAQIARNLSGKPALTDAEQWTYRMATEGASAVCAENLAPVASWYRQQSESME